MKRANEDRLGEDPAADRLIPLIYDELRFLAAREIGDERAGHTLQPTALVNEAYLRLAKSTLTGIDRDQFKRLAARAIRRVLVDHARKRDAEKRGRDVDRVTLHEAITPSGERDIDLVALTEALEQLTRHNARMGEIVELRFFGGLTNGEVAGILGLSDRSVERDWSFARAWLARRLEGDAA